MTYELMKSSVRTAVLERVQRRGGHSRTAEDFLIHQENPPEPRPDFEGRVWDHKIKCWVYPVGQEPQPIDSRVRRPRPAPSILNLPEGEIFEIFDRVTGARLWRVRGNAHHCAREIAVQLRFVHMTQNDVVIKKGKLPW